MDMIPDATRSPLVGDRLNVSDARESGREKWLLSAKRSAPEASRRAFKGVVTALISFTCSKEGGQRGSRSPCILHLVKEGGCDCLGRGCDCIEEVRDCLDILHLFKRGGL